MNSFKIILLLLKRDLIPANDGSVKKRGYIHLITFYLLPPLGMFMILMLIAYSGIWISTQEQMIQKNWEETRDSPYMALFAKGFLFKKNSTHINASKDYDPGRWKDLTLMEVLGHDHDVNIEAGKKKVFSKIYPFTVTYLNIRKKDGNHLNAREGIAIEFADSEYKNAALIEEIKQKSENHWPWKKDENASGIIISKSGLEYLGWDWSDDNLPETLWVRTNKNETEEIPLKTTIVEHLPYYDYIIPMKEWRLLESRYHYQKFNKFTIQFTNGFQNDYLDQISGMLPPSSRLSPPYTKGEAIAIRIKLPKGVMWSRLTIIKTFYNRKDWKIKTGIMQSNIDTEAYGGAMLYINTKILTPFLLSLNILDKIKRTLEHQDSLHVRGELIQTLQKSWQNQQRHKMVASFLEKGYIAIALILLIFFSLVLHTKLFRIGTLRSLGNQNYLFILLYFFEGLIFDLFAFLVALFLFWVCSPEFSQFQVFSLETLTIFKWMILSSTVGLVLPVSWFLIKLQPAEMANYRAG
jgi:hypothetical protein